MGLMIAKFSELFYCRDLVGEHVRCFCQSAHTATKGDKVIRLYELCRNMVLRNIGCSCFVECSVDFFFARPTTAQPKLYSNTCPK